MKKIVYIMNKRIKILIIIFMIRVVFDFLVVFVIGKMIYILNKYLLWKIEKMNWCDYIKNVIKIVCDLY